MTILKSGFERLFIVRYIDSFFLKKLFIEWLSTVANGLQTRMSLHRSNIVQNVLLVA